MRFFTGLVLFSLAGAVFVVNQAPPLEQDGPEAPSSVTSAEGTRAEGAAAGERGDTTALPTSFPSELNRRSDGSTAGSTQPASLLGRTGGSEASSGDLNIEAPGSGDRNAFDASDRDVAVTLPGSGTQAMESGDAARGDLPRGVTRRGPRLRQPVEANLNTDDVADRVAAAASAATEDFLELSPSRDEGPTAGRTDARPNLREPISAEPTSTERSAPVIPSTSRTSGRSGLAPRSARTGRSSIPARNARNTGDADMDRGIRGRVVDASGLGVGGVTVRLLDPATGDERARIRAGIDGTFRSSSTPAGRVALAVDPATVPLGIAGPVLPGKCREQGDAPGVGALCLDVPASGTVNAEILLPYSAGIQGLVLGADGKPTKAFVRAVAQGGGLDAVRVMAKTADDGSFVLSLLPGDYELQVLVPDGAADGSDLTRTIGFEAEGGSALILDAIDFSKGTAPKSMDAEDDLNAEDSLETGEAAAAAADDAEPSIALPSVGSAAPELLRVNEDVESIAIQGRVLSRWGEVVQGLKVVVADASGAQILISMTDKSGTYSIEDLPAEPLNVSFISGPGADLLMPAKALSVRPLPGQQLVRLEDAVVDVERVFRVRGRILVDEDAFKAFKDGFTKRGDSLEDLPESTLRRAYLRGLKVTQTTERGVNNTPREVPIASDGSFIWECTLPSEDVLFVLEPRSSLPGDGYMGPVGVQVTPAGAKTLEIEMTYPPSTELEEAEDALAAAGI